MSDLTRKVMLASMGLISLTEKRARKLAKDLIKEGELAETEESEFIETMVEKSQEISRDINKKIEEQVEKYFEKFNLVTAKDLEEINQKLDLLINEKKGSK